VMAANNDHASVVSILLSAGANMADANKKGETALWLAARNGNATVIAVLLAAGA
jgi:ankyrin repeat protein